MKRMKQAFVDISIFLLAIFLSYALFGSFTQASTLGPYEDTVYFEPALGPGARVSADTFYVEPRGDVKITINLKSDKYIIAFVLPLEDKCYRGGDLLLDSARNNGSPNPRCFQGSRVEYWDGLKIIDFSLPRCPFVSASTAEADPLPAGDGPLAILTYTALDTGSICLSDFFTHCIMIPELYPKIIDSQGDYHVEVIERPFTVKICPYAPGDINCDEIVDMVDVIFLINYLFRDGEIPCPLKAADVNCDQDVGLVDVVYLINYIFRSGPPPQTCDY
jgi:hypothetical protein